MYFFNPAKSNLFVTMYSCIKFLLECWFTSVQEHIVDIRKTLHKKNWMQLSFCAVFINAHMCIGNMGRKKIQMNGTEISNLIVHASIQFY